MSEDARIQQLEEIIRSFPGYIDNWEWFEKNYDFLKTIPDFKFPNYELQARHDLEQKPMSGDPTNNLDVTEQDRKFAAVIIKDFAVYEEGITDEDKMAQWVRNIRRATLGEMSEAMLKSLEEDALK